MFLRLLAGILAVFSSFFSWPAHAAPGSGSAAQNSNSAASKPASIVDPSSVTFPGLERYVDIHAFYSVLMRGKPDKGAQFELDGAKYSSLEETDKQGTWAVSYADVPTLTSPPYDAKTQSAVIQKQSLAYIDKIQGKMQTLRAHAKFGYQFREFEGLIADGAKPEKRFRLNCYLAGRRMYIVKIVGREAWVKSPQADAFLASFEVPGITAVPKLNVK